MCMDSATMCHHKMTGTFFILFPSQMYSDNPGMLYYWLWKEPHWHVLSPSTIGHVTMPVPYHHLDPAIGLSWSWKEIPIMGPRVLCLLRLPPPGVVSGVLPQIPAMVVTWHLQNWWNWSPTVVATSMVWKDLAAQKPSAFSVSSTSTKKAWRFLPTVSRLGSTQNHLGPKF